MIKKIFILTLFATLFSIAQIKTNYKLALLPFSTKGTDELSIQTAESILKLEIEKQSTINLIREKEINNALQSDICDDIECAIEVGKQLLADRVFFCKIYPLGSNLILQYYLYDLSESKSILIEQTKALGLEDLEIVMKRVARSVITETPFSSGVEVGTVVGTETTPFLKKSSSYNFGLTFGYLFPTYGYDDETEKSFTLNAHFDYELPNYAIGLMMGARNGFAINLYGQYLFSASDISPYVGTAFGFHWVSHPTSYDYVLGPVLDANKQSHGFELVLSSGLRLFRTQRFTVVINLEYLITFNDYNDRAIVFTIGLL